MVNSKIYKYIHNAIWRCLLQIHWNLKKYIANMQQIFSLYICKVVFSVCFKIHEKDLFWHGFINKSSVGIMASSFHVYFFKDHWTRIQYTRLSEASEYLDHLPTSSTSHWWRTGCTSTSSEPSHPSSRWCWWTTTTPRSVVSRICTSFLWKTWIYESPKKQNKEVNYGPK